MRTLGLLLAFLALSFLAADAQEPDAPEGSRIKSAQVSGLDFDLLSPGLRRKGETLRWIPFVPSASPGSQLTVESIPLEIRRPEPLRWGGLQAVRDSAERERIHQALDQTDWNVSSAARLLGTERTSLHKRIRALGLTRQR